MFQDPLQGIYPLVGAGFARVFASNGYFVVKPAPAYS